MKKLVLALLVISAIASCKKDDKDCDLNTENLRGSYKVTGYTTRESGSSTTVDEFALLDACEKDDVITLNSNNTVTFTDAGSVCDPDNNDTGIWTFQGNELSIDFTVYIVTSFNCDGATLTNTDLTGTLTTLTLDRQ